MKKILLIVLSCSVFIFADLSRYDEVVVDDKYHLMWQDSYVNDNNSTLASLYYLPDIKYATWDESIVYCDNLNLSGYDDWRLPTLKELNSLIVEERVYPQIKIDPIFFFTISSELTGYWSTTPRKNFPGLAMRVNYFDGKEYVGVKTTSFYVRCVRKNYW
jgi:hypothetical protein